MAFNETDDGKIFDAEDHGHFRHEASTGDHSYEELERKVLAALTDDEDGLASRTLGQIKRHAGLPPGFDLSPITDGMQLDGKIVRRDCGEFTAYYAAGADVKRAWLEDGRVATEYRSTGSLSVPRDEWPEPGEDVESVVMVDGVDIRKLGQLAEKGTDVTPMAKELGFASLQAMTDWLEDHPEIARMYRRIRAKSRKDAEPPAEPEAASEADNRGPKPTSRKPRSYPVPDLATVADLSRQGISVKEAAAELGLPNTIFKNYLAGASGRGSGVREAWYDNQPSLAVRTKKRRVKRKGIQVDIEELERLAAELPTRKEIARILGWKYASGLVQYCSHNPEARAALDRGRAKFAERNSKETEPRRRKTAKKDAGTAVAIATTAIPTDTEPATESVPADAYVDRPTSAGTPVENPADICFTCYADLPEDPIEIHPFDTDECWVFCGEVCRDKALAEIHYEADRSFEAWEKVIDQGLEDAGWTKTEPDISITAEAYSAVDHTHITFNDGSQLMLAFEGSIFTLEPDERAFLNDMIDRFADRRKSDSRLGESPSPRAVERSLWQRVKTAFSTADRAEQG